MEQSKEKFRWEGIQALHKLSAEDRKDLNKLIAIEQKYNLGYNIICEFCDKKYFKPMYALHHYCKLDMLPILSILQQHSAEIAPNLTNQQMISLMCGIKEKDAQKLVDFIDADDKKRAQDFAERFADGLSTALTRSNKMKIYYGDNERAKAAGLSLHELYFQEGFRDGWTSKDKSPLEN